jgi:hypothetical protein
MKRVFLYLAVALSFVACSEAGDEVALDEIHRPSDYLNRVDFVLEKDRQNDGREFHPIVSFQGEKDFDSLLEQLWKLAFSGDSKVHGKNVIGEFDEDNEMSPKQLVDALKQFDTVMIDDLLTGELKDSILDMSFTQNEVSALSIYFTCGHELTPYAIGFGKKVYNSLGQYRGISNQFFVKLDNDLPAVDCKQRFAIQSDSNGLMQPAFFDFYFDNSKTLFQDAIESSNDSTMKISFEIQLDSKGNRMQFVKTEDRVPEA